MKVVKQEQINEWRGKKAEHLSREKLKKSRRMGRGGGGFERRMDEKKQMHLGMKLAAQPRPLCGWLCVWEQVIKNWWSGSIHAGYKPIQGCATLLCLDLEEARRFWMVEEGRAAENNNKDQACRKRSMFSEGTRVSYIFRDGRPERECQRSDFKALKLIKAGTHYVGDGSNHHQAGRTSKWCPPETNIQDFMRQQRKAREQVDKQDKSISPPHIKTELSVAPSRCPEKNVKVCVNDYNLHAAHF